MNRPLFALAAFLLACAALAAPAPQPFVKGWGDPVNPDRDCKIRRENPTLTIEMPGTDHDYDPLRKRLNAPRLLRDIEGDFAMQVRVRIDCLPSAQSSVEGRRSFVAMGFLLIPPDFFGINCIRLEYRVSGQGTGADGCAAQMHRDVKGGLMDCVSDKRWKNWPFKAKPEHVYLRLGRQLDILIYQISADGKEWVTAGGGQFLELPSKLNVGLAAYSTSTDPSKVRFDQLKLIRGHQKELLDKFLNKQTPRLLPPFVKDRDAGNRNERPVSPRN